jgi:hypothetical protein
VKLGTAASRAKADRLAVTVRSREILADPGDPRALPRYLHVVGVVRVLLGDRHGDGGVRALEEPRHHRAFGQSVTVQKEEVLAHLRARDGAADEVVGAVVELVEERPDLHTRGVIFGRRSTSATTNP